MNIQTTETPANFIYDILRGLGHSFFNRPIFWFLGIIYQIFFNVATAEILENATIRNFYGRIQLILGVFMVFRLSITVLQSIVDPDRVQDKKEGFSAIIKRVIIGLLMLTILTPINIPNARNDFEKEINNNGILFGILYDLQYRILNQNTLGRLILGTTDDATQDDNSYLADASTIFTSTIAKAFMSINLKEGKTDETNSKNWMCKNIDDSIIQEYKKLDVSPGKLYSNEWVTLSCTDGETSIIPFSGVGSRLTGKDRYVFSYILFAPGIVAIAFSIILLGFTVDIAIRSFKLIVLRIIAPIPIIAYMGPESKENTAFSNWCKALATTYLDLFIRLAIVYFVLYIIIDMITNGIVIREGQGFLGIISMIFIWLGLFLFARQAPKFILDVLGVKSLGSNIGLGAILGGGAMLAGGFASGWGSARQSGGGFAQRFFGGLRGAGMGFAQGALNGMRDANEAVAQGKDLPLHNIYAQNRDLMAQMRTGDKDAKGGALGYLQDRLNYQNRELRANSLGIGKNTLAAATYEDEVAGDKYRKAQAATASAASKVSSMKGVNGGMMDFDEWSTKTGSTDNTQYAAYQNDYNNAVKEWQQLQAYEEKARVKTLITGANKKAIDESRGSLGVSPRAADVWNDSYRSQTEIEYWNEELHNQDGSLQYNDDGSVRTGITRIAVDSSGEPLAEFERDANGNYVYDQYGHRVIRDTKVNNYGEIVAAGRETGEDARQKFGYNRSTKAFDGTIDDSTFGASNRGSSGSGSGGTP